MIKKLLFIVLTFFYFSSNAQQICTSRYLKVEHSTSIKLIDYIDQVNLETLNDTPYSYSLQIKFKEGWGRYYDWKSKKFIPKDNGSNRLSPLNTSFNFTTDKIYDSEYSTYTIKEKLGKYYSCVDDKYQVCFLSIFNSVNKTYIIVDYTSYSYIYASN